MQPEVSNQKLKDFIVNASGGLAALDMQLKSFNIFDVLNISHREIRHSNFIGWLFDPNESHGFGDYFLVALINQLKKIHPDDLIEFNISDLSKAEVFRETENNIDIFILNKDLDFSITIENKVWHTESQDQLKKYYNHITSKYNGIANNYFVFLTPYGDEARKREMKEIYQPFSYWKLIEILKKGMIEFKNINTQIKIIMEQYIDNVESKILGQGNTVKNAQKIYQKYAEVIDFIAENKPDLGIIESKVRDYFGETNENYKIVSPSDLKYLRIMPKDEKFNTIFHYPEANSWEGGFIFGLEIMFYQNLIEIKFCFGGINNGNKEIAEKLQSVKTDLFEKMKKIDILQTIYIAKRTKSSTAYVGIAYKEVLNLEEFWEMDEDDMFEAFKIKFKTVHNDFLTKFIDECINKLNVV